MNRDGKYTVHLPDWFDGQFEAELPSKGLFEHLIIRVGDASYRPRFYDPSRLAQECGDELTRASHFAEPNLVVVPRVSRDRMLKAVEDLAARDFDPLLPERT